MARGRRHGRKSGPPLYRKRPARAATRGRIPALLALLCLSWLPAIVPGADTAREQRIAEQIREAILDGEPFELEAEGQRFLAIHRPAERDPARGAALLLHGRGAHPDWPEVIRPLATGLTEHGWDTLAIQLPVASAGADDAEWEATLEAAVPRIRAALAWLADRGAAPQVLIAHSFGNRAALAWLTAETEPRIAGWVAIGLAADRGGRVLEALRRIRRLPVLDLYGALDFATVRDTAAARRRAARAAGNTDYVQREAPGADHFFRDTEDWLLASVRGWLARVSQRASAADRPAADGSSPSRASAAR